MERPMKKSQNVSALEAPLFQIDSTWRRVHATPHPRGRTPAIVTWEIEFLTVFAGANSPN
jgi:hypothetical protein